MPVYEYRCEKCGQVSSFVEKMFEPPRLFFGKKKCRNCGSKKLSKILSTFSGHVERTQTEMMNELKSMGNVNFIPASQMQRPGPPGGVCPYEAAEKTAQEKAEKEKTAARKPESIVVQ